MFELKYAKMPESSGEDSEMESNAGTSVAAHSDEESSHAAAPAAHESLSANAASAHDGEEVSTC